MPPDALTLLQIVPRLDAGGVERATVDLAGLVAEAGGRAIVASAGGALEADIAAAGGEVARLPVHSKNPAVIAANAVRLARLIGRERVSLVHVRSRAPAFSALAAARRTGTPLVATWHGLYPAASPAKRWYNGVMTRGDAVIAPSACARDHLLAQQGTPRCAVALIPEGIDTARFAPAAITAERLAAARLAFGVADSRRPVALLAGRLTRIKGQALAIEAVARMGEDGPILVLAGSGESEALRRAAAGSGARVRFAGPMDDMPAALAAADLVMAPSLIAESFGRTVAEAGAMERPVLASAMGGPAEILVHGETGWKVSAPEPQAWAAALAEGLATPPDRRAAMGRAARARIVERFSLTAMGAATLALYARCMEGRRW